MVKIVRCKDCGVGPTGSRGQKYPPYCANCYWKRKERKVQQSEGKDEK